MAGDESGHKTLAFPFMGFPHGLITNASSANIPDQAASDCKNVVFFDGRVLPRPGFQDAPPNLPPSGGGFDATSTITSMSTFVTRSENYYLLRTQEAADHTLKVFAYNPATASWSSALNGVDVLYGNITQRPTATQFNGAWLFCTGANNLQQWTGSGVLLDVTTGQSKINCQAPGNPLFVCADGARAFLANAVDQGSGERIPWRVWWSKTLDYTIWDADGSGAPEQSNSGYQDLNQTDSSPITGMFFQAGLRVVVFQRHSIHYSQFVGSPVWFQFYPITRSRGCGSSGSIQSYNDMLIWLGDDFNVYGMGVDNNIQALGDAIRPRLEAIYDPTYSQYISSMLDLDKCLYWLSIPVGYVEGVAPMNINKLFVLNLKTGQWSEGEFADPSFILSSGFYLQADPPFSSGAAIQLWGTGNGNIYSIDYNRPQMIDGTKPFSARWWSKTYDFLATMQLGYPGKAAMQSRGETAEWQKISLHGSVGQAIPRIRMGKTVTEVLNSKHLYEYDRMSMNDDDEAVAYVANIRADAERFGQIGIYWVPNLLDPMQVDGITTWGLPRQDAR